MQLLGELGLPDAAIERPRVVRRSYLGEQGLPDAANAAPTCLFLFV